ncbi:MAG: CRISPR-associated protein Csx11 [Rhodospirillales bacterium]|nr:CRISPR-associated protein Csx11 [Rhodospirillales bacterium]
MSAPNTGTTLLAQLREHRRVLLGCEAIGWIHMLGKAHCDFLRSHGQVHVGYDDLRWHEREHVALDDLLGWARDAQRWPQLSSHWPESIAEFITKHRRSDGGLLGLLQAGHAMASGIEKQSYVDATVRYLAQDATHMWLSSPFGRPMRNLLLDPPPSLTAEGWAELIGFVRRRLEEARDLGSTPCRDASHWWAWRERSIGEGSPLRAALAATIAETRLPHNDVTLWDQSYVAAALFKAAVAGAVLAEKTFQWTNDVKQKTRWRTLTVGFGTRHYEARAVRIGDWVGARSAIDELFQRVRLLVEVDLALGSVVYRDDETLVFTFPGEHVEGKGGLPDTSASELCAAIETQIEDAAQELDLETPPLCCLSGSTRSSVGMVREIAHAKETLAVPVHRAWTVTKGGETKGHVCPVCLVRLNGGPTDKQKPCDPCGERRRGRLKRWLEDGEDTIWISEVADENDRLALLTFSLGIEHWLDGTHVDSLRAQSIADWRCFNPKLQGQQNPIEPERPRESLVEYACAKLCKKLEKNDPVFRTLNRGFRDQKDWESFYELLVEDRSPGAPGYGTVSEGERARWLVHQLFRKLPSPGRIYRFWRAGEAFFAELVRGFRQIVAEHPNRWRTARIVIAADDGEWEDCETYRGRVRDAPFEVLWRKEPIEGGKRFVTVTNLARVLGPDELEAALGGQCIPVRDDREHTHTLAIDKAESSRQLGSYTPLIVLERSPLRFRVLVPLDRAMACVELAAARWREEFVRVWDRLPLRVGIVAFPRLVPFQAVIEAGRNLEAALESGKPEPWHVTHVRRRDGVVALCLVRPDGRTELATIPVTLPDGRDDAFYPNLRVEDRETRAPRDFAHPAGHVYRHAADVRPGDVILVEPSRVAWTFLDAAAQRLDEIRPRPLADFEQMRHVWQLIRRNRTSTATIHDLWRMLEERWRRWHTPDGKLPADAKEQWLALVRAVTTSALGTGEGVVAELVDAARGDLLLASLEWHLAVLKEQLEA